jgi:hypothetical protein
MAAPDWLPGALHPAGFAPVPLPPLPAGVPGALVAFCTRAWCGARIAVVFVGTVVAAGGDGEGCDGASVGAGDEDGGGDAGDDSGGWEEGGAHAGEHGAWMDGGGGDGDGGARRARVGANGVPVLPSAFSRAGVAAAGGVAAGGRPPTRDRRLSSSASAGGGGGGGGPSDLLGLFDAPVGGGGTSRGGGGGGGGGGSSGGGRTRRASLGLGTGPTGSRGTRGACTATCGRALLAAWCSLGVVVVCGELPLPLWLALRTSTAPQP